MEEVQKPNIIVRFLRALGGKIHAGADYVVDISKDVFEAFLPLLKTEAADFIRKYRDYAVKVVIDAASLATNKEKMTYFSKQMVAYLKDNGVHIIKEHLLNLLREIVVTELKSKKMI